MRCTFRPALVAISFLILAAPQFAAANTFINFDVPAAGPGGAIPTGVNKGGSVVGWYVSSGGYTSFLWQTNGTVTTIKVPRMTTTFAMSISGTGWIAGYYDDKTGLHHGFLRNPRYATLDAPGAGTKGGQGTEALSINDAGEIAGVYFDSSSVEHGFIRDASGNYTSFDVSGANAVTSAILSQNGKIAGSYTAGSPGTSSHGYVRDTLGNITTFDPPSSSDTFVYGINANGEVAGQYSGLGGNGFVRDSSGNITTFTVSGLALVAGIADAGNVYGMNQTGKDHGWKYTSAGAVSSFNDSSAGPKGTFPLCVSGDNKVAGYYWDSQGIVHEFEMTQ
jgi:hypothetical protein